MVLLFTGRATRRQEIIAAVLLAGAGAVVTGLEACRRHGVRRGPARRGEPRDRPEPVAVLVDPGRQIRDVDYVHVERTGRLPEPVLRDGIPYAPLTRACIDAVRLLRREGEVAEVLSDAVQRGLTTVAALALELNAGSRRNTALPRRVLRALGAGVRSAAELEAKKLWAKTGLPEPWWNATVSLADGTGLGTVDCWLDGVAMAWEIESSEWHLSPADHDHTVERAARFVAAGVVYTASKPKKITTGPTEIMTLLRATYAHAQNRPRPPLRAVPAASSKDVAVKPRSRNEAA